MSYRLSELAELVGGRVVGDGDLEIEGVNTLEAASPEELSFLTNPRYRQRAIDSRAGALLVAPGVEGLERTRIEVENPYFALATILTALHPLDLPPPGVHPTAQVDPSAQVAPRASVGPFCSVGAGSSVGDDVVLYSHVAVGRECRIGPGSRVYPFVALYDGTILGREVIVHSGTVLGADGFGFAQSEGQHVKIPQVGITVIEDRVEIGANSAVDRAALRDTRIGEGSKLDNLVQVGHNVQVGRGCLLVSQVGIGGSTRLGDGVVLAGQVGCAAHMDVGDGVRVLSKSAVLRAVEAGSEVAGIPAVDAMEWRRTQVRLRRLGELEKRVKALESELARRDEERSGDGRDG